MIKTLTVMSLVYLVALGPIGVIGAAPVSGKIIVAVWGIATGVIAVVCHGAIEDNTGNPGSTPAVNKTPGQLAPVEIRT